MRKWTEEAMSSAVAAVKAGKAVRAASIEYGVPKSSLGDRVSGRVLVVEEAGVSGENHRPWASNW